ncbi:MAG: N-acetyl-gamma-glutamyl-phosphate reductase [Deltaproteobacteria bacterium]|nr:N-acetyl-gamma-glutamyl-phosphate reductase [Deltaproteobacteria bacterium]
MLHVAIAGVTGYGGEELLRLLLAHPRVQITYVAASSRFARRVPIAELYPDLPPSAPQLACEVFDSARAVQESELCFLAFPHGEAMQLAPQLLDGGLKVIDLSGDFRLADPAAYAHWYHRPHAAPDLLAQAVYGLPEFFRDRVHGARLVANPGCYATSVLAALLPLLLRHRIEGRIIIDAKSGFSGAGREAAERFWREEGANLRPYKPLAEHQHLAEIRHTIATVTRYPTSLCFTPHIVPAERGLLSAIYLPLGGTLTAAAIDEAYAARYAGEPCIRWRGRGVLPGFRDVVRTNRCELALHVAEGTALVFSALDNLRKGAASQAIQNMNLMCGWDEMTGLTI